MKEKQSRRYREQTCSQEGGDMSKGRIGSSG